MPTFVPAKYVCDVCGREFINYKEAELCESRSWLEYPIACMYGNHVISGLHMLCTFAVASNIQTKHNNAGASWACRDNGYGDSLGIDTCGAQFLTLTSEDGELNPRNPTFIRMAAWLKWRKYPVTVWNGERPVGLYEYIESKVEPENLTEVYLLIEAGVLILREKEKPDADD